jgi:hypothetical protein
MPVHDCHMSRVKGPHPTIYDNTIYTINFNCQYPTRFKPGLLNPLNRFPSHQILEASVVALYQQLLGRLRQGDAGVGEKPR